MVYKWEYLNDNAIEILNVNEIFKEIIMINPLRRVRTEFYYHMKLDVKKFALISKKNPFQCIFSEF